MKEHAIANVVYLYFKLPVQNMFANNNFFNNNLFLIERYLQLQINSALQFMSLNIKLKSRPI